MNEREMMERRAGLIAQMRSIIDSAEAEGRDLTAEEEGKYREIEADVRRLGEQIERERELRALESELEQRAKEPNTPRTRDPEPASPRASEEYRRKFWAAMRSRDSDPVEARDLYKGSDPLGGYLVPETYETTLIEALRDVNVMRRIATVVVSDTKVKIPVMTTKPTFAYIAEKGTYTKTEPQFGQKVLDAHKAGGIILVSEELLDDALFDLEAYLRTQFALGAGELEEAKFIMGTGSGEPTGVVTDSDLGKAGASATAVTADEIMDLIYSVRSPYRPRARFLMRDSTVLAVMKLKDSQGQYLWQPSVQAGQPDRIRGYPVETSVAMPAMASNAKSILFGDFSYYRIQDRKGISIQKLVELYAETGQVGFKMFFRNDGRLLLTEAVKHFKNAA